MRTKGHEKLSDILQSVLSTGEKGQVLSISEVLERMGERGFGTLLITLALPTFIPVLPPGFGAAVGFLYTLPFMNTAPVTAVLLLGIGLLNKDGVFLLVRRRSSMTDFGTDLDGQRWHGDEGS